MALHAAFLAVLVQKVLHVFALPSSRVWLRSEDVSSRGDANEWRSTGNHRQFQKYAAGGTDGTSAGDTSKHATVPTCAWDKKDSTCAPFEVGDYWIGELGVDECPTNSSIITDAVQCEAAATALVKSWQGGDSGQCKWCGGCTGGPIKLDTTHGSKAKFICLKDLVVTTTHTTTTNTITTTTTQPYTLSETGTDACPDGYNRITDATECQNAATWLENQDTHTTSGSCCQFRTLSAPNIPKGCDYLKPSDSILQVEFNTHSVGAAHEVLGLICQVTA